MQVTIVKDDGVVIVDGVERQVNLTTMPAGVRVIQWNETEGHSEYYDTTMANTVIDTIDAIQSFIDLWTAAAPPTVPPPTAEEMIAAAKAQVFVEYEQVHRERIEAYTGAPYSQADITSWHLQEAEAFEYMVNPDATTEWMDGYSASTGIAKNLIALETVQRVGWYKAMYVAIQHMRKTYLEEIDALGASPTQEQLDALAAARVWWPE